MIFWYLSHMQKTLPMNAHANVSKLDYSPDLSFPGKSQVAMCFLRKPVRTQLEKQLDLGGPNCFSREVHTAPCEICGLVSLFFAQLPPSQHTV